MTQVHTLEYELQPDDNLFFMYRARNMRLALPTIVQYAFHRREICPAINLPQLQQYSVADLANYRHYEGNFSYGLGNYLGKDLVMLTMLYQPVDHVVLRYEQMRENQVGNAESLSLGDWFNQPDVAVHEANMQMRSLTQHTLENEDALAIPDLALGQQRLTEMVFYGLYTHLQESVDLLCYTFGWPPQSLENWQSEQLPHQADQTTYPEETLTQIVERNSLEVTLYETAKQIFAERYTQMCQELVAKYGSPEQILPLPQTGLHDLLNQHYNTRFSQRYPRLIRRKTMEFDEPISGAGWYSALQDDILGGARWSGPVKTATLDLPLNTTSDWQIRLRSMMALTDDIRNSLQLKVNGQPLDLESMKHTRNVYIHRSTIPQDILQADASYTRLQFELAQTISPAERFKRSVDTRQIGLLFNTLDIWAADGQTEIPATCPEHRLIPEDVLFFVHIPKTAGTTFRFILDNRFAPEEISPLEIYHPHDYRTVEPNDLRKYRLMRGHIPYIAQQAFPQKPLAMTILRDPVYRVRSLYTFAQRTPDHHLHRRAKLSNLGNFAFRHQNFLNVHNVMTYFLGTDFDFKARVQLEGHAYWQMTLGVEHLERAKQRLNKMLFVGLVEDFNRSLLTLFYTFGWFPTIGFQSYNITPRPAEIEPHTYNLIAEFNEWDIQLYAYGQELVQARFADMVNKLVARHGSAEDDATNLPDERLFELLQAHYQSRFLESQTPVERLRVEMDKPVFGMGWHSPEYDKRAGWVRWIGASGTQAILDLALTDHTDLQIQFKIVNALQGDMLDSIRLQVNGVPLELAKKQTGKVEALFTGVIKQSILVQKPLTRLEFLVNRTLAPAELDPTHPDRRQLAVRFNWIDIQPV